MGTNNRQRQAAKLRKRSRASGARDPRQRVRASREESWLVTPRDCFAAAVYAQRGGDAASVERAVTALASDNEAKITGEVTALIEEQLSEVWERGWQPADVLRLVDRDLGKVEGAVARGVLAAQAAGFEELGRRVAPEWMSQLARGGATRPGDGSVPPLRPSGVRWSDALRAAVRLSAFWFYAPELPRLMDPPSAWRDGPTADQRSLPTEVLAKVRALLSKAESTTFEAEADALTAKAQELMARHRIDRVLLDAGEQHAGDQPVGRRVGVENPYADAKAALLGEVAQANGCKAVWSRHLGFTTVFGYAEELDGVDELYTSLLVQAIGALQHAGSKVDSFGRNRTTRYRRSFLVAFAMRIGERLRDAVHSTVEEASITTGTDLVPLLRARGDAADAAAREAFPEMSGFAPSASDGEGWHAGRLFGDLADLVIAPELDLRSPDPEPTCPT